MHAALWREWNNWAASKLNYIKDLHIGLGEEHSIAVGEEDVIRSINRGSIMTLWTENKPESKRHYQKFRTNNIIRTSISIRSLYIHESTSSIYSAWELKNLFYIQENVTNTYTEKFNRRTEYA